MAMRELSETERLRLPYSAIGMMNVYWPDGTSSVATATVVGRNDLLTATHAIYDPDHGGWALDMDFYFGADYNGSRGEFDSTTWSFSLESGKYLWEATGWPKQVYADGINAKLSSGESEYDVAIIGVSVPVGDKTRWLKIDWGKDTLTQSATQVGYPVKGTGMMQDQAYVFRYPAEHIYKSNDPSMGPGSSGGPLLTKDNDVIGVKSSGTSNSSIWTDFGWLSAKLKTHYHQNDKLLVEASSASKGHASADLVHVFRSEWVGGAVSPSYSYFYTKSSEEADALERNTSWPWVRKQPTFEAAHSNPALSVPVYRFWSDKHQSHFFTASVSEHDQIISWSKTGRNGYDWKYEGEGFRVYTSPAPTDALGKPAIPVYRLWMADKDFNPSNGSAGGHYFTADLAEYESMAGLVGVTREGIAFYAEPMGA